MKKQVIGVCVLLFGIAAVSLGLTALTFTPVNKTAALSVTATTYPMYTAALQVVGDAEGVSVNCLTAPTAGCLHDYQLSPAEMTLLSETNLLVMNGGGAEAFLQTALAALPTLDRIDTSADIDLLCAEEHEHDDGRHHGEYNEHLWVSPARYAAQVRALRDGLCAKDPANADRYTANANAYLAQIAAVEQRLTAATLSADGAVLFHDSVAYAADALGLTPLATLPIGEDNGIAVGELTAAAEAVRGEKAVLLFDSQYPVDTLSLDTYASETTVLVWDTAVVPQAGVADKDAWLSAMQHNLNALEAIV